jgi:hypothetical protein
MEYKHLPDCTKRCRVWVVDSLVTRKPKKLTERLVTGIELWKLYFQIRKLTLPPKWLACGLEL